MSPISIGQIYLDQFRVDAFIASGGMGSVYRVWDLKRNVPLAMKVLHADLADDNSALKRFKREANALKKLAHPNIVPFYGLYQLSDIAFLLEGYIDGSSLKEILRRKHGKPMSADEVLIYLRALCAALGYAHANGVVHCDVKPGNVLVDKGGNIYLTDFGITRHAESTTTTLATVGTAAYMAPEQIRGEPVSPATDIYALGVILFEMLTGKRPFQGDEPGTESGGTTSSERMRYAHLSLTPPNPCQINPLLSESICSIILQTLHKEPGQRFQNTQALYTACCEALKLYPPERAGQAEPLPVTPHDSQSRSKKGIIMTGGFGLLIVFVLAFLFIGLKRTPSQSKTTQQMVVTAVEQTIAIYKINSSATNTWNTFTPTAQRPTYTINSTHTALPSLTITPEVNSYYPLAGCALSRLHTGDWVYIADSGQQAIRNTPDTHPSDNIVSYLHPGDVIQIIGEPECNYGWVLWKVRRELSKDKELEGWTPEGNGIEYWLVPITYKEVCVGGLPTRLNIGDQAYVGYDPPLPNRVRSKPERAFASQIGYIQPGEQVTVIDGPQCSGGWVFWKIRSLQTGLEGWTAEGESPTYWLVPYTIKS